ncbi:DUF2336 domain-containing protein [Sinorhizobium mexicanum]|uniref:DUF2336 domain-containing protein n=1 Tax=Sinorhizobium mexicanum TaxID=375549 RepID=A0A859QS19_9HYPH|nr:DUF2336 domain-containing protein [Sinorhizobium mexicanum]MBP1886899.1 uncharacterized protein (DUF2336 family) [Sinorhizobium mexicanum]QLL61341.1 DUF2336 domain-containing protein [Sinorhizobium mexicanum]
MIIQAFLRWVETARTSDRVRAASALGRAYVEAEMNGIDRHAAEMAMTFLLDDPSPKVRHALVEALADFSMVPRAIVMSLAEDQPEIAYVAISRSPVLTDEDLVDLAARGTAETRALIAARSIVSRSVAAAIAEIGGEDEVLILLENKGAMLTRWSLNRIANRLGHAAAVRDRLLRRPDLPSEARHELVEKVGAALAVCGFVQAAIGERRVQRVAREACEAAALVIIEAASQKELPELAAHLREAGRLTPAFLLHALCSGRTEFFSAAIVDLSGVAEKRVRAILSGGRVHPIRALFESAGLGRDVSEAFAEAVLLWRKDLGAAADCAPQSVAAALLAHIRHQPRPSAALSAMAELVERLAFAEQRQTARNYALLAARHAA